MLAVINNGGGKIFEKVPRLSGMSEKAKEWMAAETVVDFEAVAKAFGMDYLRVTRTDDFDGPSGDGPLLLEVIPKAG